jgi:hypothetical protein
MYGILVSVRTVLNHPLFTILGNEVKRTKLYAITAGLTVINAYLYSDFCVFDLPETQQPLLLMSAAAGITSDIRLSLTPEHYLYSLFY